ncbi:Anti-sigma regulatory factor (Ser/Thr protein kinase) [Actinacidiphila yanglinensis]|uniref:Anti-sigma regulatory factor (Ser/Thr protein kinase) n=2 Tax=Actinacidiphila yanglinensis TaxID=310779 RepID=A0A1H6DXQ0_9ACTN|nr:Anti-sigma regulatory factor (Ser/Thr protein kinase) [Actinacidiphila yanglinensis]
MIMQSDQTDPAMRECALELEAHPYRIQQIRRIVSAQLRYWRVESLVDAASTGISELLANVHRHAKPDKQCAVKMTLVPDRLTVAVADHDTRLPHLQPMEPTATTGRGLAMVEAMCDGWGTDLLPDETGKVVWFVLRTPTQKPKLVPLRTAAVPLEKTAAPERIAVAASVA